jgi:hypothetical protein
MTGKLKYQFKIKHMNITEEVEKQVKEAEETYFRQLDLAAELLGHPHRRDPRHAPAIVKEMSEEKTTA